ncbi:hypothetical protein C3L23_04770 [Nautilia sp. PV-1]|uniref:hypothetical protein n=1 Tax=Nautilia sp. PV-1 TaxID=2579250 RepID=UPI000FDC62FC|nr:hypothetical protein [Nautilia sp. PV-1]AZV46610.1 hypothetical protein C3L23_04770 [Nautilia sp. PV-1]
MAENKKSKENSNVKNDNSKHDSIDEENSHKNENYRDRIPENIEELYIKYTNMLLNKLLDNKPQEDNNTETISVNKDENFFSKISKNCCCIAIIIILILICILINTNHSSCNLKKEQKLSNYSNNIEQKINSSITNINNEIKKISMEIKEIKKLRQIEIKNLRYNVKNIEKKINKLNRAISVINKESKQGNTCNINFQCNAEK